MNSGALGWYQCFTHDTGRVDRRTNDYLQNIHIKDRTPLKPGMTPGVHDGKQFLHH